MINTELKNQVAARILPQVQTPGQYVGGEWNCVVKDHRQVRGTLCLAFPDAYSIGMSHHGLQVLYAAMNRRDWACERVFTPGDDMERLLREHGLPLYSLETFTPLRNFDVLGFTLQYDLCFTNVLTMLDLGGITLHAEQRGDDEPLVIAGGPCTVNPEPMARFFDLFVIGDGEEALPAVCDLWLELKRGGGSREDRLLEMARRLPYVYAPRFYAPGTKGTVPFSPTMQAWCPENWDSPPDRPAGVRRLRDDVPEQIVPAVVENLDAVPLPCSPVVPNVECVQDRITLEIMRGCPGKCRFCQSTTLKRPLRFRSVDTLLEAAAESYRATGYNEISLLSLATSDYPQFDELMRRFQETFRPLGVAVSLPSLRVNEELKMVSSLLNTDRHSGLTLAPEAARDELRQRIGKSLNNEDLYAGCREAFANGFHRVKLYFMVGLPGETEADWDGIVEMSETIARIGKEIRGRYPTVVANVANFVPKPQTPFQWQAMQQTEYFFEIKHYLKRRLRLRCVELKMHDVETSWLEGVLCRGDRRVGEAIELAWRRGARFDAWREHLDMARWRQALSDAQVDVESLLHLPYPADAVLPWDHVAIRQGRSYLERERDAAGCG